MWEKQALLWKLSIITLAEITYQTKLKNITQLISYLTIQPLQYKYAIHQVTIHNIYLTDKVILNIFMELGRVVCKMLTCLQFV